MIDNEDDLPPPQYFAVRDHRGNLVPHEQMLGMQRHQQEEQRKLRRSWEGRMADLQRARDSGEISERDYAERLEMMESVRTSLQTEVPGRRGIISVSQAPISSLMHQDRYHG